MQESKSLSVTRQGCTKAGSLVSIILRTERSRENFISPNTTGFATQDKAGAFLRRMQLSVLFPSGTQTLEMQGQKQL